MQTTLKYISAVVITICLFSACQQPGGNSTGSEYMPDMAHSVAYETNYYSYYYHNTWGTEDEYYKMAGPRQPVKGTIARSAVGTSKTNALNYPYDDTEEERTRAIAQIIENPYSITDSGLAEGKELYNVMCGICHGEKGDGLGYLVRDDGGKYPAAPANFLLEEHLSASNGRYYHAIMYGKNVMGAYKDKLSYEERWNVIHYIRSMQAKELKVEYNQMANTLNTVDRPAGEIVSVEMQDVHGDERGHGSEESHAQDHESKEGHRGEDRGQGH
ncbi:MAG: c-type cytochrome [Saprospiraceae bacterium]